MTQECPSPPCLPGESCKDSHRMEDRGWRNGDGGGRCGRSHRSERAWDQRGTDTSRALSTAPGPAAVSRNTTEPLSSAPWALLAQARHRSWAGEIRQWKAKTHRAERSGGGEKRTCENMQELSWSFPTSHVTMHKSLRVQGDCTSDQRLELTSG